LFFFLWVFVTISANCQAKPILCDVKKRSHGIVRSVRRDTAERDKLVYKSKNVFVDDPLHAIEAGEKYGIKMLSPEEARRALPHFGGLGD
jgi:hypothetical protein